MICSRYYLNCSGNQVPLNDEAEHHPGHFSVLLPHPIDLCGYQQFFVRVDEAFVSGNAQQISQKPLMLCTNIAEQQLCNNNYDNLLAIVTEGKLFQSTIYVPAFPGRFYEIEIFLKTSDGILVPRHWLKAVSVNLSILHYQAV